MTTVAEMLAEARRLHQAGDLGRAEQLYRQLRQADPANGEVAYLLGMACHQGGRLADAAGHYRDALRLAPNLGPAYLNLGEALAGQEQFAEAEACLRECLRRFPQFPEAHFNLANIVRNQGRLDEATTHYREALRLRPNFSEAENNLANTLLTLGRADEAAAHFRQAARQNPYAVHTLLNLAANGLWGADDPSVEQLKFWLTNPRYSLDQVTELHFVLGYVLDQAGAHDEAFEHIRQGNTLRRVRLQQTGTAFQADEHTRRVDRIIAAFTPEHFRQVKGYGVDSEVPVFIVGMPRSGTTLVEQILSCHPTVHGAGELKDLAHLAADLPDYPERVGRLEPAVVREVANTYLGRLTRLGGAAERVTDKAPENFLHLGLIATLFPRARVIHCRRDPRDVCVSCFFQYFRSVNFARDLGDLGRYYRDYERLMAHWRAVLPLHMFEVAYEELVADQEAVSRRLVEYCGLEWDDRCLKFYENPRPVETMSKLQVRRPMYSSSVGRWRRYARHLRPFLRALGYPEEV